MVRHEVPRLPDDYSIAAARRRMAFLAAETGTRPEHVGRYSFDPAVLAGNIENFVGVAQVPIGIAGPLLVDGEHARGTFYVPLATTEGTLVASYNRGMKLIHQAGGVRTTVMADVMQRAPAFGFNSAREARAFGAWVTDNFAAIKSEAESTTRVGRLHDIEQFSSSRFMFLRFSYTTGDAAGQNLTGQGDAAGVRLDPRALPGDHGLLPGGQPGHGQEELARQHPADPGQAGDRRGHHPGRTGPARSCAPRRRQMFRARQISNLGGLLAGVNNNGNHSANAIAALFAATGQDIANVAESSAALVHTEILADGSYYYSITIPALIVATYGGGTGLPTQRECLELLGCYGPGQVNKLAEIVAATVLCGEISLGAAVVADEWVTAHERLGRNRP